MLKKYKGQVNHTEWIDLKGNGIMVECAVLKEDDFGNTYFIEIPNLDGIDKNRLARIVSSRNAHSFPLWDVMSQVTLNNGMNALAYFHQLVKIITQDGVVMNPRSGTIGVGTVNTNSAAEMKSMELNRTVESVPSSKDTESTLTPAEKRAATIAAKKAAVDAANPPE